MAPTCWCRSWSCMQSSSHVVHWRQSCWTTSVESRCWECTCSRFTAVYQNIWCRAADCQHRYIYASCLFVKDIISSSSHIFFLLWEVKLMLQIYDITGYKINVLTLCDSFKELN